VLQSGVVFGPGSASIAIEVPRTTVSGTVTLAGGALPATLTSAYTNDATIWAVAADTGIRHILEQIRYTYSGGPYALVSGSGSIDTRLVPGTYDIVYERGTASSAELVYQTDGGSAYPNGERVLREDVVFGAGTASITIDIPRTTVTGAVTLIGRPLPATLTSAYTNDVTIWAIPRDTGVPHILEQLRYTYAGGPYALVSGSGTIDARLVPGVYDLLYERGTASSAEIVYQIDGGSAYPNGDRYLRACVALP
jgi:hypothetical protein